MKTNYIAVSSFILSIISIPLYGLGISQLIVLILSIIAYKDAVRCNNKGKGFAIAGIVISSSFIILWVYRGVMAIINPKPIQYTETDMYMYIFRFIGSLIGIR